MEPVEPGGVCQRFAPETPKTQRTQKTHSNLYIYILNIWHCAIYATSKNHKRGVAQNGLLQHLLTL